MASVEMSAVTRTCRWPGVARWLRVAAIIGLLGAGIVGTQPGRADGLLTRDEDPYEASTSRKTRREALDSIPLERLKPEDRKLAEQVLSDISIFRRLPTQVVRCDPDLYLFLLHHPDVVVGIWQAMGISQIRVEQTGPDTFSLVDHMGTVGKAKYLYRSSDLHILYTQGVYDGPLMAKPAQGSGILVLRTSYVIEPDGRYYITARLDAFMHIDNLGLEMVTKVFHPLLGKIADFNFQQTYAFVSSLSRTAEVNIAGIEHVATKLTGVRPEVRDQFVEYSRKVAEKARRLEEKGEVETAMQPDPIELK